LKKLSKVSCFEGFYENKEGDCVGSCGTLKPIQTDRNESVNSSLKIVVHNAKTKPNITLRPLDSALRIDTTKNGTDRWVNEGFAVPVGSSGEWELEYRSGTVVCGAVQRLNKVACNRDFINQDGNCTERVQQRCSKEETRFQGNCLVLKVDATIATHKISEEIFKESTDWRRNSHLSTETKVQLRRMDEFKFSWRVAEPPSWLSLSRTEGNQEQLESELSFIAGGLRHVLDRNVLKTQLVFTGTAKDGANNFNVPISKVEVEVTALGMPSLHNRNSTLEVLVDSEKYKWPTNLISVTKGSNVHVYLDLFDDDGEALTPTTCSELRLVAWAGKEVEFKYEQGKFHASLDDLTEGNHEVRIAKLHHAKTNSSWEALQSNGECWLPVQGSECTPLTITVEGAADSQTLVLGALVGLLLASMIALVFYLIRQHPHKVKKLLISFVRHEARILLKILMELWDFITDAWLLFGYVIPSTDKEIKKLVPYWLVACSIASIVSLVATYLKIRVFMLQLRHRREDIELQRSASVDGAEESVRMQAIRKYKKRIIKTHRSIQLIYASFMIGIFECVPLGILQIIYAQYKEQTSWIATISLITTWLMLGMKVSKVPDLYSLWEYKAKNKTKVQNLSALEKVAHPESAEVLAGILAEEASGSLLSKMESVEMGHIVESRGDS
jgi:hypothetical protein